MDESDEVWKPIVGFADYEASSLGRIRNVRRGRIIAGTVTKRGHRQVNVRGFALQRVTIAVHQLVAAAFLGPPPFGHILRHLNGNRLDNRPTNLEWAPRTGHTRLLGESNPNAKLTTEKVHEMRKLRQQGVSLAELGRRFGVTERAAHRVVMRRDWRHVE